MSPTPEIDADRCSLGRLAAATCSACTDACPRQALTADPDGLQLDPDACSGCGACAAACPAEAVDLGGLERPVPDRRTAIEAWLACPRHPLGRRGGAPLCLQAVGIETLARFWLAGLRRVACLTADCATCPDGAGLPLQTRLETFAALTESRGLPGLSFRTAVAPPRGAARLRPAETAEPDGARRRLFGLPAAPARRPAPALARVQGLGSTPDRRYAHVPRLDAEACSGCDACTKVCPTDALSLIQTDAGAAYAIDAAPCTGCGLCVDVCGEAAVALNALATAPVGPLPLTGFRCRGCGVQAHAPTGSAQAGQQLCTVCRNGRRGTPLRQVID